MTDQENRVLYIAEQCRKAGMTLAGTAGVLANVAAESAFIPINVQDTFNRTLGISDEEFVRRVDAGDTALLMTPDLGFGLVQWTAQDRKEKFLSHMRKIGVSIGDFRAQVDYMILDMRTFYDKRPWEACTGSNDPEECGYKMCKHYEICSNLENESKYRGNKAKEWYTWLQEHTGEESSIPDEDTEPPEIDDDGMVIQKTWPPRTIDFHCSAWPEVWLLQGLLKSHGYNVTSDGMWTNELTLKLQRFQKSEGLDADGVCGKNTWIKLGLNPAIFERR